jgi:hypothetical protein
VLGWWDEGGGGIFVEAGVEGALSECGLRRVGSA